MEDINLFNRICDAAEKLEKRLPANQYFMVYSSGRRCTVSLMDEWSDTSADEELDGDSFKTVRQFKDWAKFWLKT